MADTDLPARGLKPYYDELSAAWNALIALIQAQDARITALEGKPAPAWGDITGKPATFPPAIGTTATTALAGNTALVKVGTGANDAMAGNTVVVTSVEAGDGIAVDATDPKKPVVSTATEG